MKKKATYTSVHDFLCDDDFIRYTLDSSPDAADGAAAPHPWSLYASVVHPAHDAFCRATHILLHLDECTLLTEEQMVSLKRRIFRSLSAVVN